LDRASESSGSGQIPFIDSICIYAQGAARFREMERDLSKESNYMIGIN
jgi:hypothetical protein